MKNDGEENFNRYSYVFNNPLKYTDPSGEFAILDSWVFGFIDGFFSEGGNLNNRFMNAGIEANHRAENDAKITLGLVYSDPNKSYGAQFWEIFSRTTWQLPQTLGGWHTTQWTNSIEGNVNWVDYKYGATVVQTKGNWGGVTQGSYIMGDENIEADENNELFQHEYGHYIQSQNAGWLYYPKYALPSLNSANKNSYYGHAAFWVEQDANIEANKYFNKYTPNSRWNYSQNPIFHSGKNNSFDKHYGYLKTNTGVTNPKWWEYTISLTGPIIPSWFFVYFFNINKGQ